MLCVIFAGCAQPAGPVFAPLAQPLVWPEPPETPRVAYVGSLSTEKDLNAGVSVGDALSAMLFGRREPHVMVTPYAVTTDGNGRVFIADTNAHVVHMFNLESRRYEQWTPGKDEHFAMPVGIVWHESRGVLYVADSAAGVIHCFDRRGSLLSSIMDVSITRPCGLAIDEARNMLYIADAAQHAVIVLDIAGHPPHTPRVITRIGERGSDDGQFNFPTNVAVDDDGCVYVSDSLNFRVQAFDADGNFIRHIGRHGRSPGHFAQPKGIAADRHGRLYVVDANFEAVQIFDRQGRLLLSIGEEGTRPGQFWIPAGIHISADDRIWVADSYNRRVQVFQLLKEADNHGVTEARR